MLDNAVEVRIQAKNKVQYEAFVRVIEPLFDEKIIIETAERRTRHRLMEIINCDPVLFQIYIRFHHSALEHILETDEDPRQSLIELILALNEPDLVPG